MKRFAKYAAAAALVTGAAIFAAAPASAAVSVGIGIGGYGYAPRGVVCDPYSRFYDPFYCARPYNYYAPSYYGGGPLLSFGFNSGFHDGWHGRGGWHGNSHGGSHHNGGGRHH
jgi:hypothetical protein